MNALFQENMLEDIFSSWAAMFVQESVYYLRIKPDHDDESLGFIVLLTHPVSL